MLTTRRRDAGGFTLMEVLLTMGILMVVMIPLLLWATMVFRSGADTGVADDTNSMTTLSRFLQRDASGVKGNQLGMAPLGADATALNGVYAQCGMPATGKAVLHLIRPGEKGSWIVYYTDTDTTTTTGKDQLGLYRLKCTKLDEPGDKRVIVTRLANEPVVDLIDDTQIRMAITPKSSAQVMVSVKRNITPDEEETTQPFLSPIIECKPSCTVNRQGSAVGSTDANALKASVEFSARLSRSELPISHYQWSFIGADGQTSIGPVLSTASSPIATSTFPMTYSCRSITLPGKPASTYWQQASRSCKYQVSLTIWSGGSGGSPAGGSPTKTVSQSIEVRNNPPRPVVAPVAAVTSYGVPVDFSAVGTSDIDGKLADVTYAWEFNDGSTDSTASGISVQHAFSLPVGTRIDVKLTVTDDDGEPVVVMIPIQIDISLPNVVVDPRCTRNGQPEEGESCLGANTAPWNVVLDAHRTSMADPDPAVRITDYRWVYNYNEDVPWVTAVNGKLPANPPATAFPAGVTPIDLQVRTNQTKDGERVVGHWYGSVIVNGPPIARAEIKPSPSITPLNSQWDPPGGPYAAQRFILDGSGSYESNPLGAIASYVWEVRAGVTGTGTPVYTTPANLQDRPIIGCTGYMTPGAFAQPWVVTPGPTSGASKACTPLTYNGNDVPFPAGKYTAALTVTNHLGKVTRSQDVLMTVNRPPNAPLPMTNVPGTGQTCNNSWATPNGCVYRGLSHAFEAGNATDPDGDTVFTYDWTFTGNAGTSLTYSGKTANMTFLVKDELVNGVLTVTDDKGGIQKRFFSFYVRNQNPKSDVIITQVHGSNVSGPNALVAANTYNILSGLSPADPGTTVFSAGVATKDTDTGDPVTCEWTFETAYNTPAAPVVADCSVDQTYTWPTNSYGANNLRKVTLKVTDSDNATSTTVKQVRLYKRPTAAVTAPTQTVVGPGISDITFNVTGSSEPNGGGATIKYWVSYGDDCDAQGQNCVAQLVVPNGSNQFIHRYNRAGCKTNIGICGAWKMQVWTESSLTPAAFTGPSEPPKPASNGLSLVAEITVRVNEKPRVVFGGTPAINSRVISPIDVNGESYKSPNQVANDQALGFLTCLTGTSCTYQADASKSVDPDGIHSVPGQTDGIGACTGPLQVGSTVPNDPCLTYTWSVVSNPGFTSVTIDPAQRTLPSPVVNLTRSTTAPANGNFRLRVEIKDRYNETTTRDIYVKDLVGPALGTACKPFNAESLGRGVTYTLDGSPSYGLAGGTPVCTSTPARITQTPDHYSIGIFNGPAYGLKVDATAAVGANPATLVRQAAGTGQDQTKNSWVNEKFMVGTRVTITSASLGAAAGTPAVVSAVTDSTLTFSGTPAFNSLVGATDVIIVTKCGGGDGGTTNGMNCVPDHTDLAGTGFDSPNYVWKFTDTTGGGSTACNATIAGKAATFAFRPTANCIGNVTLTVTDETGTQSAVSPTHSFSVADAKPVANIATTSPVVTTNPATDIVGTQPGFAVGFDGSSSYDPDGAPGAQPGPVSTYRWTVQQTAPTAGAETQVSTAAVPNPQITFPAYGSYTVKLYVTDAAGQTGTRTVLVKVYQRPDGKITASTASPSTCTGSPGSPVCNVVDPSPYSVTFGATGWVGYQGATISSYSWDFGDPATGPLNLATGATPPAHVFSAYGDYTVTLTVTDSHGVTGTQTAVVHVDPPPTVDVTFEYQKADGSWVACPVGSQVACSANRGGSPVPVRFTAAATATSAIATYAWTFGDPPSGAANSGTGAVVTHTYPANGTYTAHLVVTTVRGAQKAVDLKVKANQLPIAVVTSGSTNNPATLDIARNVATTTINGGASSDPDPLPVNLPDNGIQAWHWVFTGQTPGNGCDLVVDGKNPTITLLPPTTCDGTLVLTVTDYDGWTTSTPAIPVHVTQAAPIAVITTDKPNDIGSLPDGVAVGETLTLIGSASNQPGAAPGAITSYVWVVQDATMTQVAPATCISNPAQPVCKWSDGSGANPTVRPSLGVGSYRAYLIVTAADGQTAQADRPFRVDAPPKARITAVVTDGNGACSTLPEPSGLTSCTVLNSAPGVEGPFRVTFSDNSSKNGSPPPANGWTWSWNFGDPASELVAPGSNTSTQRNPAAHTFSGYGTFTVTLTVTDEANAVSTTTALVTIHRPPTVAISANYSPIANPTVPAACTGSTGVNCAVNDANGKGTVNFTATASAPDGSITSYAWAFGDGQTSTAVNPTHLYNAYGLYTVTVTVTDNAGATARDTFVVKINQKPVSTVTVTGGGSIALQRGVAYDKLDGGASNDPDKGPGVRPDNGISSWSWKFTSSNPACTGTYNGKNPTITMTPPQVAVAQPNLAACSGTMVLTVTDHDGGVGVATTANFVVNNVKPVAGIVATGDLSGVAPFSPTFAPTGSNDPDTINPPALPRGDIAGYEWTVFKGAVQYRAPIVQTSFAEYTDLEVNPLTENGTYTVRLVVIDTHGTRSDAVNSATITVLSAPTPNVTMSAANEPERSNGTAISLPSGLPLPGNGTIRVGSVEFDGSTSVNPNGSTSFVLYAFEMCKSDSTGTACDPAAGSYHQTRNAPAGSTKVSFLTPGPGMYIVRLTVMDSAFANATSGWYRVEVRA